MLVERGALYKIVRLEVEEDVARSYFSTYLVITLPTVPKKPRLLMSS